MEKTDQHSPDKSEREQIPTPRTDAMVRRLIDAGVPSAALMSDLARELERDLALEQENAKYMAGAMDTRSAEGATTFTTTEEANCYQGGECDRGYPPCPGPKLCRKRGESAATPNAGAQPTEPKDPPPPVPGLHVPPFVYDPKQGKMVSTTPGFKELCAYLRALYDKTADAHGGLDYPDRVNVALIAVYDYGRRKAASSTALKPSDDVVEILTHLCEQAEQMTHMLYPSDAAAMGVPCTERARAYLASLPSSSGERADAMWEAAAYCRDCAEASERCGAENRAAAQHEMANELQRRAAATPSHERQP